MAGLAGFDERPGDRLGNIIGRMAGAGWQQYGRGRAEDRRDARGAEAQRQQQAQSMLASLLGIQGQDVQLQQVNQAGRQQDYRNQLSRMSTLAQLLRAQRPEALGAPAQRALLSGMAAPFMAQAQQRVIQEMFGGDEARFRASMAMPGSNTADLVRDTAYAIMLSDPRAAAGFGRARGLLSAPPAYRGATE